MERWNPATYLQFADERSRPFVDLLARVGADRPGLVVDLGCGPGQLTASLSARWPEAAIVGVDSSPDMIDAARMHASGHVRFELADLRTWRPSDAVDVLVSNAALQWVPEHRTLLPRLVDALAPGGWLAFQVPGNFDEPSHRLLRELAADSRFAASTGALTYPSSHDARVYLADLTALGCEVDAWETTYVHVLTGPDPVFRWISGTGARPVLQALDGALHDAFVAEYKSLLCEAYPAEAHGTVLPFRRIFCVARRRSSGRPGG
jgi:trans-aconitate 2-methyltransferase